MKMNLAVGLCDLNGKEIVAPNGEKLILSKQIANLLVAEEAKAEEAKAEDKAEEKAE